MSLCLADPTLGRVTDVVRACREGENLSGAVRVVRQREPEWFRWRSAVRSVCWETGKLFGRNRVRTEEPVREMVLDLSDHSLRQEVVVDARRYGMDLDRGEVLPMRTEGDLRRLAYLMGVPFERLQRDLGLRGDFFAPVDTAAAVCVGRVYARAHQRRAHRWSGAAEELKQRSTVSCVGLSSSGVSMRDHHVGRYQELARIESQVSTGWGAFARTLLAG